MNPALSVLMTIGKVAGTTVLYGLWLGLVFLTTFLAGECAGRPFNRYRRLRWHEWLLGVLCFSAASFVAIIFVGAPTQASGVFRLEPGLLTVIAGLIIGVRFGRRSVKGFLES
jgi:peptidoglycan/LPS O-acetylase OafA/YrhL